MHKCCTDGNTKFCEQENSEWTCKRSKDSECAGVCPDTFDELEIKYFPEGI